MDSFVRLATHGIRSIRLQQNISKASIRFPEFAFNVQVSDPYITTGNTKVCISLIFVTLLMFRSFHNLVNFIIIALAIDILRLISPILSPLLEIRAPK
jgi:hypothetical protein